jgi:hypothetical protein
MPNRMLRDWTDSLRFEGLPATTERLFVRLIMKADDFGRFHADPRLVRAACFPLEDCDTKQVEVDLAELQSRQLVYCYQVDGRHYLAIVNYGQRLKQSRPKFPPADGEDYDWKPTSGNFQEVPARRGRGRGTRSGTRSGSGSEGAPLHASVDDIKTLSDAVTILAAQFPTVSETAWASELNGAEWPQAARSVQEYIRDELNSLEPSKRPTARLRAYLRNGAKYTNGTFKEQI